MKLGDLFTATELRSDNEGDAHLLGKARLVSLLNAFPSLTKVFTCGDIELRIGSGVQAELEVGWPKVMPRCTFDSYRIKRGETPDYIFDVGVFRDNELIGVCEVYSASRTYAPKVAGVLRSGLWLIEVAARDLSRAVRADRPAHLVHIPCAKVFRP
jgi:hypothetical protein